MKFFILYTLGTEQKWREVIDNTPEATELQKHLAVLECSAGAKLNFLFDERGNLPVPCTIPEKKGEVAELFLKGFEYDVSLPQDWLNRQANIYTDRERNEQRYEWLIRTHVWLYDGQSPQLGRPYNILSMEKPTPIKDAVTAG